ncbi:hypothetical protein FIV00_10730 [Labrenzia sp. THAF82]|uniref:hypothetical protein n=1 Tax=Labrenzia sp. THAF82 TaxID=2587861 RepID=UPI00126929FE|nr:hypothetical protein [Labrenzia sp. THAF82]QFT30952.1 hypothetical protein FIV00_10730 [Labrenzia sp. THAF82]
MALNLDRSYFSVVCDLGNCLYTPERELEEMSLTKLIEDVRGGQLENIIAIFEFNPEEGWCNDITDAVLSDACPEPGQKTGQGGTWSDYSDELIDGKRAGVQLLAAA